MLLGRPVLGGLGGWPPCSGGFQKVESSDVEAVSQNKFLS